MTAEEAELEAARSERRHSSCERGDAVECLGRCRGHSSSRFWWVSGLGLSTGDGAGGGISREGFGVWEADLECD